MESLLRWEEGQKRRIDGDGGEGILTNISNILLYPNTQYHIDLLVFVYCWFPFYSLVLTGQHFGNGDSQKPLPSSSNLSALILF